MRLLIGVLSMGCASAPITPVILPPALDADAIIGKPSPDNAVMVPAELPRFDPVPVPSGMACGPGHGPGILVDQATAVQCRLDAAAARRWMQEAAALRALRSQERAACQAGDIAYQRQAQALQAQADRARWAGPAGLVIGLALGVLAANAAR